MSDSIKAVLLLGFGGPPKAEDAESFVRSVVGNRPGQESRISKAVEHYRRIGGSPFAEIFRNQALALERSLSEQGLSVPVFIGFRHWTPFIGETIEAMTRARIGRVLAVIMAPHRCYANDRRYLVALEDARQQIGPRAPSVSLPDPWHLETGFITAVGNRLQDVAREIGPNAWNESSLVFSAHAIPDAACQACPFSSPRCPYMSQIRESANAVARSMDIEQHHVGYQSISSGIGPWTRPDLESILNTLSSRGKGRVVVCPIGFLSDHVEVLYDLDVEFGQKIGNRGLLYHRAATVGCHPDFIQWLTGLVESFIADGGQN